MVGKARLFGDEAIATHILKSTAPEEAIELGREVRGFEQSVWVAARYDIVVAANRAKFTARPELGVYLTQHTGQQDPGARESQRSALGHRSRAERHQCPQAAASGEERNLLGFALMEVRDELRAAV